MIIISLILFKADENGIVDFESTIETKSITLYEGPSWFAQDINGDGDRLERFQ